MKKLASLVLLFAMLAGVSCTTDATEDLTLNVGGENGTVISISLDGSRIALGDKVDGEYKALWSEGDKISINGIASGEAAIDDANKALATFSFEGALATPYNIVYPAAATGKVVFASEQSFVNGTFSEGATPMYGYSESGDGVTLKHLAGVLKIGVTGSKTLTYAQVSTIDRAPIAGVFDIDCATGEVTATEGATEVVSYSFGEGLALSGEAQYIHLAVPAGVYNELYVTLYDKEGGVMYATVKATDEKPLNAGAVREFTNAITYEATDEVFVIKDVASLQEFKAAVEADTPLAKDAIFVADVDLSEVDWVSINGETYTKTILGNGYAIKGLKAPLFNITSASFKGLHLRDLNIAETVNPNVGGLVRYLTATDEVAPTVENCSATGAISVNCTEFVYEKIGLFDAYNSVSSGALVGAAYGVNFADCHNEADVTITQVVASSNETVLYPWTGGVVGLVEMFERSDKSVVLSNIYRCENDGDISVAGNSFKGETVPSKTASPIRPYVGGVAGGVAGSNLECTVQDIVNRGDITLSGALGNGVRMAGTFGYVACKNGSNIYNYGKVSYENGVCYYLQAAGGIGVCVTESYFDNVHNYGEVYIGADMKPVSLVVGGLIAYQSSGGVYLDDKHSAIVNSSNNGDVTILCDNFHDHTSTSAFYYRVGGFSGWTQHIFHNCVNNGNVTCRGTLSNYDTSNYSICIGGLVGYKTVNTMSQCTNNGDVDVDIDVITSESADLTKIRANIGGLTGYSNLALRNSTNNGDVTISGTYAGELRVGGLGGHINTVNDYAPINDNCTNNGAVTVKDGVTTGGLLELGGCYGYVAKVENAINNGTVSLGKTTIGNQAYIGGVGAYSGSSLTTTATNKGNITIADGTTITGVLYVGGIYGYWAFYGTGVTNEGDINIGTITHKSYCYTGGVFGYNYFKNKTVYIENAVNRGNITSKAYNGNTAYYAGVGGYTYELEDGMIAVNGRNWENYGKITMTGEQSAKNVAVCGVTGYMGGKAENFTNHESGTIYVAHPKSGGGKTFVGGVSHSVKDTVVGMTNYADITIEGVVGHTLYGAGAIVSSYNYNRTDITNYGNYTINAEIGTNCFVGGMMYDCGATSIWKNCHNHGDIIVGAKAKVEGQIRNGGFFGKLEANKVNVLDECSNSGDVISYGTAGSLEHYGCIIGSVRNGVITIQNGFTNTGNVIYSGKNNFTPADAQDNCANSVSLGGLIGCSYTQDSTNGKFKNDTYPAWTGKIENKGNVIFNGTTANNVHIGGILGASSLADIVIADDASLTFSGSIQLTGTFANDIYTNVGGIVGSPAASINGAQALCSIEALNVENTGMIFGTTRIPSSADTEGNTSAGILATNCKVGGKIAKQSNSDEEPLWIVLAEDNYFEYIYGGTNIDWTGTENWDGCTFISPLE